MYNTKKKFWCSIIAQDLMPGCHISVSNGLATRPKPRLAVRPAQFRPIAAAERSTYKQGSMLQHLSTPLSVCRRPMCLTEEMIVCCGGGGWGGGGGYKGKGKDIWLPNRAPLPLPSSPYLFVAPPLVTVNLCFE